MKSLFSAEEKIYRSSSPGRLDVMGGVADYSGSLLLQMPIRERVEVALQKRNDGWLHVRTKMETGEANFSIHWNELQHLGSQEAGKLIRSKQQGQWASYIIGCVVMLSHEKKISIHGLSIEVESSIPWGKGVSSSAALETAVMQALADAFRVKMGKYELPVLCQRVENEITGAACGLMDQLSVYYGRKSKLLPIRCQPYTVEDAETIPDGIRFYGIDSGVRHAVSGSSYEQVRAAAFMGYTIIAMKEGTTLEGLKRARDTRQFDDLPYKGYLANISPSVFTHQFEKQLPEKIPGFLFLQQIGISIDTSTTIDPSAVYFVRACANHPVKENQRIRMFRQLLRIKDDNKKKEREQLLGELMFQSHQSYTDIGLGNERTDAIVQMVRDAGPSSGVYGARITGGGSGGTVCVLTSGNKGKQTLLEIHARCCEQFGMDLYLFKGSSNGALTLK